MSTFYGIYSIRGISGGGGGGGSGTVTSVSVTTANGMAGTVANATTTPAITLSTTITAPALAGNGTAITAAHVADTSHDGYLSSTDWNTFNGKQAALTIGDLTDTGTDGITVTGGTGSVIGTGTSIAQHVADTTHNGYLSSTDWNTFDGKQASGNYITALTGDVSASGPGSVYSTLATVNANVGSFGDASNVPTVTVNSKGLVTAASSTAVVAPAGTLSGTTLNSTVVSSSLTSVGTISTGVWDGTKIDVAHGGTNLTSGTSGGILSFTGTTTLASSAALAAGGVVYGGGAGATPSATAAGTSSQVLIGGTTPSFGSVPAASLPIVVPGTSAGAVSSSGLTGNMTGSAIAAGFVGEIIDGFASSTNTPASSGNYTNLVILPLTAGIWDVSGGVVLSLGSIIGLTQLSGGISKTSVSTDDSTAKSISQITVVGATLGTCFIPTPVRRVITTGAGTTNIFLVASATYSSVGTSNFGASNYARATRIA